MKKRLSIFAAVVMAVSYVATIPANATALSVSVNSVVNATTAQAPQTVSVPSANVIDVGHSVSISATADNATSVVFTASPTIKLVNALSTQNSPVSVVNGVGSYSVVSTGAPVTVYAYTTSVATGSVTITNGAYSTVVFIQGLAGSAYNVLASVPTAASINTVQSISVSTTDVFGNAVGSEAVTVYLTGTKFSDGSIAKALVTASAGDVLIDNTLTLGSKSATLATSVAGSVTVFAVDTNPVVQPAGLPAPVRTILVSFNVVDLNAQITALQTKVSDLVNLIAVNKVAYDKSTADLQATTQSNLSKAIADAKVSSDKALAEAKVASDKALMDALANAKVVSDKQLSDALNSANASSQKAILDAVATANASFDKQSKDAKTAFDKQLSDLTAQFTVTSQQMKTANDSLNIQNSSLQSKYNRLVNSYNAKAKRFKFALIK